MSDMLNEKFEEFIAESGQDPMPGVGASVVPGNAMSSGFMQPSSTQTNTAVNAKAAGRDPMPTVSPSVVPGQSVEITVGPPTRNLKVKTILVQKLLSIIRK